MIGRNVVFYQNVAEIGLPHIIFFSTRVGTISRKFGQFIGMFHGWPHVTQRHPSNADFSKMCFASVQEYVKARSKILKAKKYYSRKTPLGSRGFNYFSTTKPRTASSDQFWRTSPLYLHGHLLKVTDINISDLFSTSSSNSIQK